MGGSGGRWRSGAGVRLWARSELRRRWRALVSLGVIAGLAAGLALAAVAGARRTSTAYERNRRSTAAPDAILFATQLDIYDQDYSPVLALPEVVDGGIFELAPVGLKEFPLGRTLAPGDDRLYRTLARPLLVDGRLPDPGRADEVVVNREAASRYHLRVGQHVTVIASTDITDFFTNSPPTGGPELPATIVGIGDSTMDAVFGEGSPGFVPSGAFLARFPEVPRFPNLVVRLRPGTDVARFSERAAAALGLPDIPVRDLGADRKRTTRGTDLERTGLLLFAAAALLAGLVLVGQAVTRTVYAMAEPVPALRALGLTNGELARGLLLPQVATAAAGAVVTVASAVAFSSRFPVGLARRLEPDVGVHADWPVLLPGGVAVAAAVLAAGIFAAYRATRPPRPRRMPADRPTLLVGLRRRAPLPVAIGAGLALGAGRGDRSLPARPALLGAVVGVLGVIGALGLVQGIDDALAAPERSGQAWDASVLASEEFHGQGLIDAVRNEPDVGRITEMRREAFDVDGESAPVYTLTPVRGRLSFTLLDGRAPSAPHEAAIGPASAKALGKTVGDTVEVVGPAGSVAVRIVGTALLPETPHSEFDQGLWISPSVMPTLDDRPAEEVDTELLVTARPGVPAAGLAENLAERFAAVEGPSLPQDVLVLRNVRTLPRVLALFLVLLGVAALGHALVTAVRRRRHDLAVLRAIGFRPAQNAVCIISQATTVAAVGLLVGLPLGAVAGRLSWRWVADATPLVYVAPVAVVAITIAVPVAITTANVLAALPARRAARLRPAEVLRTE